MNQTPVEMYLAAKDDICTLITDENQNLMVPACPDWSLRDLLAHLVGSLEDFCAGDVEDVGSDRWTTGQVDRYAGLDLAGIKTAWNEVIANCGDGFDEAAETDLPDIAVHEHDIRAALGNTEQRDSEIMVRVFQVLMHYVDKKFLQSRLPALRITTPEQSTIVGEGAPQGELRTTAFDATRLITGRRSATQIRAMDWSTDPGRWVNHLPMMRARRNDLIE